MLKKLLKHLKKYTKTKRTKNEIPIINNNKDLKPELRVLWVSRYNMLIEAYMTLKKLYKDYNVCIYPCQPRVLEARQIICLAEKYNVDIICSIMSDKIYTDLMSDATRIKKYTILRPSLKSIETNRNFSPLKSLKICKEKIYQFEYWEDMKTGMKIKLKLN